MIKSTNITENGFVMDGKTVADAFTQLNKNINVQLSIKNVNMDGNNPSINMTKYGHVVILTFYDIRYVNNKPEGQEMVIAEGLPAPLGGRSITAVLVSTYSGSVGLRVGVRHDGKLVYWWVSPDVKANVPCSGQLVYLAND